MDTKKIELLKTIFCVEDSYIAWLDELKKVDFHVDNLEPDQIEELQRTFDIIRFSNPYKSPFTTEKHFLHWLKELPISTYLHFLEPFHLWVALFSCMKSKKVCLLVPKNHSHTSMGEKLRFQSTTLYHKRKCIDRLLICRSGFWISSK